jgi:hypothetical protein
LKLSVCRTPAVAGGRFLLPYAREASLARAIVVIAQQLTVSISAKPSLWFGRRNSSCIFCRSRMDKTHFDESSSLALHGPLH